uniref:Mitochondrial pyruvate carrier n=1 Tax=Magallana gigas TaxID=29159 RepID=K1P7B3_MAGGI
MEPIVKQPYANEITSSLVIGLSLVKRKGGVAFNIDCKSTVPKLPPIKTKRIQVQSEGEDYEGWKGPKYIHFWAPTVKWCLSLAGLGNTLLPEERLSVNQSLSLVVTGCIWARYSLVIIPVNYNLMTVNLFMAMINGINLFRAVRYQYRIKEAETTPPKKE